MSAVERFDVVVIGGGMAGLVAARDVSAAGRSVCLVEARPRLGGRTYAANFAGTDHEVEFGGTWVIPAMHHAVMAELDRYGLQAILDRPAMRQWVLGGRSVEGDLPERARAGLEAMAARLALVDPDELDGPADALLRRIEPTPDARDHATAFLRWINGADPAELSGTELVDYGDNFIDPDYYDHLIEGGTGALARAITAEIRGEIRLGWRVVSIVDAPARESGVTATDAFSEVTGGVVVSSDDGRAISAAAAVVAVPVNVWPTIGFDPPLDGARGRMAAIGQPGHSVKVWMIATGVPEGYRGFGVTAGGFAYLRAKRRLEDGTTLLVGFGWDPADFPTMDSAHVTAHLRHFLPEAEVLATDRVDWVTEPESRGTWFARMANQRARVGDRLDGVSGRIVFAGSDVAPDADHPGSIEGALVTGRRAAVQAIALLS